MKCVIPMYLICFDLSGISIFSKEQTEEDPLIIAGGCCTYNPEPLAPFIDIFYLVKGK